MHRTLLALSALLIGLALPAAAQDAVAESGTATLTHKVHRKWKLTLPAETWNPVATGFAFESGLGATFKATPEGTALLVDTDGDGTPDVKAEGTNAFLTLRGPKGAYALRLVNQRGWRFAASGSMVGEIAGTPVQIIDQNGNGRYDDWGVDAMIVGRGKFATFLSKVVSLGDRAVSITLSADGTELGYSPFTAKTGVLRLDCDTKAKVLGAVLQSVDGRYSFDAARAGEGMTVPAGLYTLHSGQIGLGQSRVQMRTGRSRPIEVPADDRKTVAWGGPVDAEFRHERRDAEVAFSPDAVWYYGALGEEYLSWAPIGKSPKFTIVNKKTGREIATAYFPGSC